MMRLSSTLLLLILIAACKQNPKACLDLDENYEVGREYTLTTCSENYEFITWDFGENKNGFIGDEAPHTFQDVGRRSVTIEAFSKGAYNSDATSQSIRAAYRIVDYVEIIGESNFDKFILSFGSQEFPALIGGVTFANSAQGTFTEEAPFVGQVSSEAKLILPMDKVLLDLDGKRGASTSRLLFEEVVNYRFNTSNPVIYTGTDFTLKLYWKFD